MTLISRLIAFPPIPRPGNRARFALPSPAPDRVVLKPPNPFANRGDGAGGDALVSALRARVAAALGEVAVVEPRPEAIVELLLDAFEARRPEADEPAQVGNRHPPGSKAWFDEGRRTGVWFAVDMGALARLLDGHGIRPEPGAPDIDPRNGNQTFDAAGSGVSGARDEYGDPVPRPPSHRIGGIDVRGDGVRSFEQEVVLAYLHHLARASAFLARAAGSGAEAGQLAALAGAALRRGRLDVHVGDDVRDRLEDDRGFDHEAGRAAVANQAFWLQLRAGDEEVTFGNLHDLLPTAPLPSFRRFAEDSRMRLNVDAAGDRMMKELHELARTLDVDAFDEPRKRRERVAAAITAFGREAGADIVRLALAPDGGAARARYEAEVERLLELALSDLDALARELH